METTTIKYNAKNYQLTCSNEPSLFRTVVNKKTGNQIVSYDILPTHDTKTVSQYVSPEISQKQLEITEFVTDDLFFGRITNVEAEALEIIKEAYQQESDVKTKENIEKCYDITSEIVVYGAIRDAEPPKTLPSK